MICNGRYYEKHINKSIKCLLCPHSCTITNERFGLCSVRVNQDGILKTVNYGEITSVSLDPIEKKPLYHFKPGSFILSVGSFGCNLRCSFCQNYTISQSRADSRFYSPDDLTDMVNILHDNIGIAFTYNEPTIWYEYVYDTSKLVKHKYPHLKTILVTNGYISSDPLKELLPFIDALNIDLKFYNSETYKKITGAKPDEILKTIETACKSCHIEITTLLINNLNDSPDEVEKIASFIAELDKNIPLHLSRYYPAYKMGRPPTDIKKIIQCMDVAKKHLNFVYLGNISSVDNSTYCPLCGRLLIARNGYYTNVLIEKSKCPDCGKILPIHL